MAAQRDEPGLEEWLLDIVENPALVSAVLAEDTRPRFHKLANDCFLLIVRGVNLNPGEAPDDMLSLRILFYRDSLITLRKRPFKAVREIVEQLKQSEVSPTPGILLLRILEQLHLKIEEVLVETEKTMDELQEELETGSFREQKRLTVLHRRLLKLNRFLKPQTAALNELVASKVTLLDDSELVLHYLNQRDVICRIVENIEAYIDQVWMLREHNQQAFAEIQNRNAYRLSLIAGIFLPISFITGLLGVNVSGIPGAESPLAFAILCVALTAAGLLEFALLRRLRFW